MAANGRQNQLPVSAPPRHIHVMPSQNAIASLKVVVLALERCQVRAGFKKAGLWTPRIRGFDEGNHGAVEESLLLGAKILYFSLQRRTDKADAE